jgi:hypothetical protein
VVKSAEQPKLCDGTYLVYDGKRRYEVSLKVSETLAAARADQVSDGLFICTAKLSGATLRSAEDAEPDGLTTGRLWPMPRKKMETCVRSGFLAALIGAWTSSCSQDVH